MKKGFILQSLICLLAVSCSVHEMETTAPVPAEDDVFYASLEPDSQSGTKVHVELINDMPKILWDAKDQISIFNKTTLNQQYEFLGNTGDNAGYFKRVTEETETRTAVDGYVCAIYPYMESTSLDDSGVLTLTLPDKQTYIEGSFGHDANTMVSTTDGTNNLLKFKNVGGYLVLKFYGGVKDPETGKTKAITIQSIKLEGRNGEPLSGEATMTPVVGEVPEIKMSETAGTSITLNADKVKLGKTANEATEFWIVVPPTDFTQGMILTVTDKDGKVFIYESDIAHSITRNGIVRGRPIEVVLLPDDPDQVIYYTTSDKKIITPSENAAFSEESLTIASNNYVGMRGIMVFSGEVKKIGNHAFEGCETLTGMTIPATVTSIGEFAFAGCTRLGAQNTPSGSDISDSSKAANRSDETTFVIPEGVTSIGAHAFENCASLTSIDIPDSVTSIGDGAFAGCTNLTDINIPDSVTEMGENVFNGCTGITSVTIPYGVTSIDDYAFAGCSNLVSIDIPETVTSIGKHAFEDCEILVDITIPSGVKRIEDYAFAACMELPSINIPGDVTYIGPSAFESCFKLANVTLPSSVGYIGSGAFASCDSFTSFDIPENVTTIYGGTFQGCDKLAVVSIPEGVTAIGFWAFYECPSLSNIIIPSTVTSIDDQAFLDCPGLTSITVLATYPPEDVSERTFENTNECPIFVPAESLEAYKTAEGWSNYVSRIHTIGSPDGKIQDHDYVDMGKGLKWATTNVDADSPDGPGSLFAWGRTEPITLPIDASISIGSFVDTASELWGDRWRMPTIEEWDVLKDDDYYHWTWDVERKGYVVESLIPGYEGNSIFLPAAGATGEQALSGVGTEGFYWSSTPNTSESNSSSCLWFSRGSIYTGGYFRGAGLSVRPVSD